MFPRSPCLAHPELSALRGWLSKTYHTSYPLLHIRQRSSGYCRIEAVAISRRSRGRAGRTRSTAATMGGVILSRLLGARLAAVILVPRSRTSPC
ncbi:hypothetical protein OH76DRAFT_1412601 [Lentinus brumalis]|uniref:Uncharacterized protein n=1 Tax=Lentinus brumalis TaxID=2498619 RepID=A0A371CKP9_9APHY|nr:hypothetical protein OH76DRAFT_1412601 [Polyporus brumalis]